MMNQMRIVAKIATRIPQLAVGQRPRELIRSFDSRVLAFSEMFLVASAVPSEWIAGIPAIKLDR